MDGEDLIKEMQKENFDLREKLFGKKSGQTPGSLTDQ
mgnify:CR=1 FL=1